MSTKVRQLGHNSLGLHSANQQKKGGTVGFQVLRQRSDNVVVNAVIYQRSREGPGPGSHETAHRKASQRIEKEQSDQRAPHGAPKPSSCRSDAQKIDALL